MNFDNITSFTFHLPLGSTLYTATVMHDIDTVRVTWATDNPEEDDF